MGFLATAKKTKNKKNPGYFQKPCSQSGARGSLVTIPVSDPLPIPKLPLALMSLQSVAALFKMPAAPREECSGARGVGAAVTACLLHSYSLVPAGGRGSGVWPDETQMGCAAFAVSG